jgi:hypothetical protein
MVEKLIRGEKTEIKRKVKWKKGVLPEIYSGYMN